MGLSMVRETPEKARSLPASDDVVDVIALSAVPLNKDLSNARERRELRLRVRGVEASALAHDPPLQRIVEDQVHVRVPSLSELPKLARVNTDESLISYTESGPFLMVDHAEIMAQSRDLVEGVENRKEAVAILSEWVYSNLRKAPTVGIPNALEVLRVRQGDCNEHTALFVALARAAGIPARTAAGLVYSDRVTGEGAFYYHAWPEVHFGEQGWVPVDPTFNQFPADATHIKVVNGGLDKQIAIMGIMGRLSFSLLKSP
jgi:transglutaminase-like putative cysteine protease